MVPPNPTEPVFWALSPTIIPNTIVECFKKILGFSKLWHGNDTQGGKMKSTLHAQRGLHKTSLISKGCFVSTPTDSPRHASDTSDTHLFLVFFKFGSVRWIFEIWSFDTRKFGTQKWIWETLETTWKKSNWIKIYFLCQEICSPTLKSKPSMGCMCWQTQATKRIKHGTWDARPPSYVQSELHSLDEYPLSVPSTGSSSWKLSNTLSLSMLRILIRSHMQSFDTA